MKTILMSLLFIATVSVQAQDCNSDLESLTQSQRHNLGTIKAVSNLLKHLDQSNPEVQENLMALTIGLQREKKSIEAKIENLKKKQAQEQ